MQDFYFEQLDSIEEPYCRYCNVSSVALYNEICEGCTERMIDYLEQKDQDVRYSDSANFNLY